MLGLHHSLLRFCTLLIFVFFHLHERRAKLRGILLPTHVESFNASILEARLHEIFRSYGCEWRWKLSQLCLVRSIPWKAARIECHHLTFYISRIGGYSPYIQTLRFSSKS